MRVQPILLNHLIEYWHLYANTLMLEGQSMNSTTMNIYFLTGLCRRGEPVNLRTFPLGPYNIEDCIMMYFEDGTKKLGSQVSKHNIPSLHLQIVLFMIGRITGSTALHQASHEQMHCVVQCLDATILELNTTMLTCMKKQLIDCRRRTKKKFEFKTMLCAFLFERVPSLSSRETV
jgi:hypothetical protein